VTIPPFADAAPGVLSSLIDQTRAAVHDAGFSEVLIGLSGGLDSALVAHIAVQALGSERVHGLILPAAVTSQASIDDARKLAAQLAISTMTIDIEPLFQAFKDQLAPILAGRAEDVTEENLQARIRGTLLMALSNKFGWFVLNTGNLSESLMGYSTLHGDMVGGFAPIGALLKTQVRELARAAQIPESILTKEPSAELAEGQLDRDALGPYEEIDPILYGLTEGADPELVARVQSQRARADFKLRYEPPAAQLPHQE